MHEKSHLMELMRKKYHCTVVEQRILFGCKKVKRKQKRNKHGHCGLMLCGQVLLTNVWRENVLQPGRDRERERGECENVAKHR